MPVNMDPQKRLRKPAADRPAPAPAAADQPTKDIGEETQADKEKALADAEWKNLWDATEVIDMDKF